METNTFCLFLRCAKVYRVCTLKCKKFTHNIQPLQIVQSVHCVQSVYYVYLHSAHIFINILLRKQHSYIIIQPLIVYCILLQMSFYIALKTSKRYCTALLIMARSCTVSKRYCAARLIMTPSCTVLIATISHSTDRL